MERKLKREKKTWEKIKRKGKRKKIWKNRKTPERTCLTEVVPGRWNGDET